MQIQTKLIQKLKDFESQESKNPGFPLQLSSQVHGPVSSESSYSIDSPHVLHLKLRTWSETMTFSLWSGTI